MTQPAPRAASRIGRQPSACGDERSGDRAPLRQNRPGHGGHHDPADQDPHGPPWSCPWASDRIAPFGSMCAAISGWTVDSTGITPSMTRYSDGQRGRHVRRRRPHARADHREGCPGRDHGRHRLRRPVPATGRRPWSPPAQPWPPLSTTRPAPPRAAPRPHPSRPAPGRAAARAGTWSAPCGASTPPRSTERRAASSSSAAKMPIAAIGPVAPPMASPRRSRWPWRPAGGRRPRRQAPCPERVDRDLRISIRTSVGRDGAVVRTTRARKRESGRRSWRFPSGRGSAVMPRW